MVVLVLAARSNWIQQEDNLVCSLCSLVKEPFSGKYKLFFIFLSFGVSFSYNWNYAYLFILLKFQLILSWVLSEICFTISWFTQLPIQFLNFRPTRKFYRRNINKSVRMTFRVWKSLSDSFLPTFWHFFSDSDTFSPSILGSLFPWTKKFCSLFPFHYFERFRDSNYQGVIYQSIHISKDKAEQSRIASNSKAVSPLYVLLKLG